MTTHVRKRFYADCDACGWESEEDYDDEADAQDEAAQHDEECLLRDDSIKAERGEARADRVIHITHSLRTVKS